MTESNFFSTLPAEIKEEIVRKLSSKPNHKFWPSYIDWSNLNWLLDDNNLLGNNAIKALTSVTLVKDVYPDNFSAYHIQPSIALQSIFTTIPSAKLFLENLSIIREFNILYGSTTEIDAEELTSCVVRNCTSFTKLQILDKINPALLEVLLGTKGSNLTQLSIWLYDSFPSLEDIPIHCTQLRQLEVSGLQGNIPNLWNRVGDSLEILHISFRRPDYPVTILNDIKSVCRNLKEISIRGWRGHMEEDELVSFYTSYGTSLKYVNLKSMRPASCSAIISKCPNIKCTAGHRSEMVSQMDVLSTHITKLEVHPVPPDSIEMLRNSSKKCKTLVSIHGMDFAGWNLDHFKAIFCEERLTLKEIRWDSSWPCMQSNAFFVELLHLLSQTTRELRKFSISLEIQEPNAFKTFASRNKSLEYVKIALISGEENNISVENAVQILEGIVRAFKDCLLLKELKIVHKGGVWDLPHIHRRHAEIDNECVALRRAQTCVQIGEIEYLK